MRAIFCHLNTLLRDSHLVPEALPDGFKLVPATIEAMRMLSTDDSLVFVFGPANLSDDNVSQTNDEVGPELVRQIEAGGGRVDGLIICHHDASPQGCRCWGRVSRHHLDACVRAAY